MWYTGIKMEFKVGDRVIIQCPGHSRRLHNKRGYIKYRTNFILGTTKNVYEIVFDGGKPPFLAWEQEIKLDINIFNIIRKKYL